jgi:hypothetical protein
VLDLEDAPIEEPVEPRSRGRSPWILVGVLLAIIIVVLLLANFIPSADAAGSCGGG